MQNITLRYGLYYAVILCLGFVASYLIFGTDSENYSKSEVLGYSIMLFASVIILFAVRAAKQNSNNQLSFSKGLGIGLGVSAIGGLAFAVYNWVYVKWLHPEFFSEYMVYQKQLVLDSGLSENEIQQQLSELATYSDMMGNSFMMAVVMFVTVFAIGVLFSLVAAAAFRSKSG